MREDPKLFLYRFLLPYMASERGLTTYYTRSLKKEMDRLGPLPPFNISPVMKRTADIQARDLARVQGGHLNHTSSDGTTFSERMRRAGVLCAGENLYSGINRSPLDMIMDLLIDQGVANLGHRKALLSPDYHSIGISIRSYTLHGKVMVQDFDCR